MNFELVGWQAVTFGIAGAAVAAGFMVWSTFALIHADEAKSRRRQLEGAGTEDLKRVERELEDVQRELRKRRTLNG